MTAPPNPLREGLLRQLETSWQLTCYHLDGLTTEECLWRPARAGLHVQRDLTGAWRADWPDHERYDLGPPSIAWTTWHIGFWWSMAIDAAFGSGRLTRAEVLWPGDAEGVRRWITGLHDRWCSAIEALADEEWTSTTRTKWPFADRPFSDVVAWANVELAKNAAEIGYGRFLHAVSGPGPNGQAGSAVRQSLGLVSVVVRDYDEAIRFYVDTLGFTLIDDSPVPEQGKRWVVVAPPGPGGARVLLARGVGDEQIARIGNQTGGRVFLFLYTDDFQRDYDRYRARGVQFVREPSRQPYGTVAVFRDLYGNLWDLVELQTA